MIFLLPAASNFDTTDGSDDLNVSGCRAVFLQAKHAACCFRNANMQLLRGLQLGATAAVYHVVSSPARSRTTNPACLLLTLG